MDNSHRQDDESRRSFLRKAGYLAPAVLTLKAAPAFASHGSSFGGEDECENNEVQTQQYRDLFKRWQDLSSTWHW